MFTNTTYVACHLGQIRTYQYLKTETPHWELIHVETSVNHCLLNSQSPDGLSIDVGCHTVFTNTTYAACHLRQIRTYQYLKTGTPQWELIHVETSMNHCLDSQSPDGLSMLDVIQCSLIPCMLPATSGRSEHINT